QIFTIFIITVAAGEAAVGLAIIIQLYRLRSPINVDEARELNGYALDPAGDPPAARPRRARQRPARVRHAARKEEQRHHELFRARHHRPLRGAGSVDGPRLPRRSRGLRARLLLLDPRGPR